MGPAFLGPERAPKPDLQRKLTAITFRIRRQLAKKDKSAAVVTLGLDHRTTSRRLPCGKFLTYRDNPQPRFLSGG